MTKKHFNELAMTFKLDRPLESWDANKRQMWNQLLKGVAGCCKRSNPRFDEARFYKAAGGLFDLDRRAA